MTIDAKMRKRISQLIIIFAVALILGYAISYLAK